jgi:hypothetical protein
MARWIHMNTHKSIAPTITGQPLPIGNDFEALLDADEGISYADSAKSFVIDVTFPPGIIGRLYEVGIRSSNVRRIRVQLIEVPNGLLYSLATSNSSNLTNDGNTNPRLTGFPPVKASAIRVFLLETTDGRPPRHVSIFTKGCFYRSSVQYTTLPTLTTRRRVESKSNRTRKTQQ